MMRSVHLDLHLPFDTERDQAISEDVLLGILGAVAKHNFRYLLDHPETPTLYESGVVYSPPDQVTAPDISRGKLRDVMRAVRAAGGDDEAVVDVVRRLRGVEKFRDIPTILERGHADCDGLMGWRLGELWRGGVLASPWLEKRPNDRGGLTYHALVAWPGGGEEADQTPQYVPEERLEDPSLILGMDWPNTTTQRQREIAKNEWRQGHVAVGAASAGASPIDIGYQVHALGLVPTGGFPQDPFANRRR